MSGLFRHLFSSPMCENCGVQPKFPGFEYCGKTCAAEADQKTRAARQKTNPSRPPNPVTRLTSTPRSSSSEASNASASSNMCHTCGVQPKLSGLDYCGKTCAAEAVQKGIAITRTPNASQPSNPVADSKSISHRSSSARNTTASTAMCINCGVQPKFGGVDYCGKTCATEAERKKKVSIETANASRLPQPVVLQTTSPHGSLPAADTTVSSNMCLSCGVRPKFQGYDSCGQTPDCPLIRAVSAQGPPNPVAGQGSPSYKSAEQPKFNTAATSSLCEHCFTRPKSREPDDDGTVITHSHCGIRCYKASQSGLFPASTIPAPAAAFGGQDPLKLRAERVNTPVGRKILLMMRQRWQSETVRTPQVKSLYRIDFPKEVYRRFDLALQMNDDCTVKTTYYGGTAACSITDDTDPAPCASEFCELCDALRHSFSNLLQGASCRDGRFGPGLYTYLNPALAHNSMVSEDDPQEHKVNYALIQCRVVTQANNMPTPNSYAGLVDDSGVVFCAQSTAVIPTHVLIYRLSASSSPAPPLRSLHSQRGLFNTLATASNAVKQAAGGDPQSMAGLPAPAPTPAPMSNSKKSMPQASRQADSAASGSGHVYIQRPAGWVRIPAGTVTSRNPGPGKEAPLQSAVSIATAANKGLTTPALDPATKALRELVMSTTRGTPLNSRSSPPQARIDDADALDYLVEEGTSYPTRGLPHQKPSTSYGANRNDYEQATRKSFYPLTSGEHDHDLRASTAATRNFMTRSNDFKSRIDEDDDLYLNPDPDLAKRQDHDEEDEEDLNFLTPDPGLARRQERYEEDVEDLDFLTPDLGLARRQERYEEDVEDLDFLTPDLGLARRQERYEEDVEDLDFLTPDLGLARRQERYEEDVEDLDFLTPDLGLARRQERYDEDEEDLNFLTPDPGLARRQEQDEEDEEDLNFLTPDPGLARRQERYDEDEEDLNFLNPDPGLARRRGQDMYIS